jgi:hypothetical protein
MKRGRRPYEEYSTLSGGYKRLRQLTCDSPSTAVTKKGSRAWSNPITISPADIAACREAFHLQASASLGNLLRRATLIIVSEALQNVSPSISPSTCLFHRQRCPQHPRHIPCIRSINTTRRLYERLSHSHKANLHNCVTFPSK